MGEFILRVGSSAIHAVRNTLHIEGSIALWTAAWTAGEPPRFQIGLTGINIPWSGAYRPDWSGGSAPGVLELTVDTTYADITQSWALEGGAAYNISAAVHRSLMGYEPIEVGFTVVDVDGAPVVVSDEAVFTNNVPWSTYLDPENRQAPRWSSEYYGNAEIGYPWGSPWHVAGRLGELVNGWASFGWDWGESSLYADASIDPEYDGYAVYIHGAKYSITAVQEDRFYCDGPIGLAYDTHWYSVRNPCTVYDEVEQLRARGSSLPLGAVYLATIEDEPKLVASAVLAERTRIPPGGTMTAIYRTRVRQFIGGVDDAE